MAHFMLMLLSGLILRLTTKIGCRELKIAGTFFARTGTQSWMIKKKNARFRLLRDALGDEDQA